jgi:hypothetical protein
MSGPRLSKSSDAELLIIVTRVSSALSHARLPIYPVVKTLDSRAEFTHGLANVSQPMVQKI